jgi:SAM-dependent methyltransferase
VSETALPRLLAGVGRLMPRPSSTEPRLPWLAMVPRDIGLFIKSARTDARIARVHQEDGCKAAFEAAYQGSDDPWASASPRYRYQGLKYNRLVALLPRKRFAHALDLGCGLGLLSQKLAARAERVLGVDIAPTAIEHARRRGAAFDNLAFEPGDILDLPTSLNGKFGRLTGSVAPIIAYFATVWGLGYAIPMMIGTMVFASSYIAALLVGPETKGKQLVADLQVA